MSFMKVARDSFGSEVQELTNAELEVIAGGADARMIANGLGVLATGIALWETGPLGAAVATIGVHMIAAGIASHD
jgi:hypothetical protein